MMYSFGEGAYYLICVIGLRLLFDATFYWVEFQAIVTVKCIFNLMLH